MRARDASRAAPSPAGEGSRRSSVVHPSIKQESLHGGEDQNESQEDHRERRPVSGVEILKAFEMIVYRSTSDAPAGPPRVITATVSNTLKAVSGGDDDEHGRRPEQRPSNGEEAVEAAVAAVNFRGLV